MADAAVTPDDAVTGPSGADGADAVDGGDGSETKVDTAKAEPIDVHPPKWFERGTYRALYILLTLIGKVWLRVEMSSIFP